MNWFHGLPQCFQSTVVGEAKLTQVCLGGGCFSPLYGLYDMYRMSGAYCFRYLTLVPIVPGRQAEEVWRTLLKLPRVTSHKPLECLGGRHPDVPLGERQKRIYP